MLFCTNINLKWDHNSAFYFITSFPLNNISLTYFHDNIYGTIVIVNSCPTLCNPMDCSTASFPVLHHLPEFAQTYVHGIGDAIQPSHPLSPRFFSCCQSFSASGSFPMTLFQSSHPVAKVLELQLQHQSFQWIFRVDCLDWLVWSRYSPRILNSQQLSPAPQFKSTSSSALSFLYGPTLRSAHDYWKNHNFN